MTRAALYLRISRDAEGQGLGVERQRTACQELAKARGWRVDPAWVLDENDVSATRGKRPKFERLLEGIESGDVEAVVAYSLDRLQRSLMDLARLVDLAERRSVPIVTATGELDLTTPLGRANAKLLGVVASIETDNLSDRLRRKAAQNVKAGRVHNGGRRPYGYTVNRAEVVPEEAAVIREVAARLIDGESLTGVAKDLNRRDITTAYGRPWDVRRVREVMQRPRICGRVVHDGQVLAGVKGDWPAILDEETFDRVQVAIKARRRAKQDGWRTDRKYLLSGTITRCGVCGEKVIAFKQTSGVHSYRCSSWRHVTRDMQLTDAFVIDEVRRRAAETSLAVVEWHDPDQEQITARIAELEARKVEAAEQFADGSVPADVLRTVANRLQEQIDTLRDQQVETAMHDWDVQAARFDLVNGWDEMSIDERRAAIGLYVERIVIHPQKARGRGAFDTTAIEIIWRDVERLQLRAYVER